MFRTEPTQVEYQVFARDDGYQITREGVAWDFLPFDWVRIYVDDETLLESYFAGAYKEVRVP